MHFIKRNYLSIIGFLLLFFIILTNQVHQAYPDEFENILGGIFILKGRLPYSGFFTHHNPFAYFFAVPIALLSGASFVKFRIILGVVYLASFIAFFIYIKKRFSGLERATLTFFYALIVLGSTYMWGHMLLADSLSALLLAPVYITILFSSINKREMQTGDIWLISILSAFALLTSSSLIFAVCIIYLFTLILVFTKQKKTFRKLIKLIFIFSSPYLIFLFYLLVTGSLEDFYLQSIRYNTDIYISLPGGVHSSNPIRIAIIYFNEFMKNFRAIATLIKDFNFYSPFAHALVLSNLVIIAYLVFSRQFLLAGFVFLMLVYSSLRGNPYETKETDYQSIQYHYLSLFNGVFVLGHLWDEIVNKRIDRARKLFYSFFIILLGVYMFFLSWEFFGKWWEKSYLKYMGEQPLIYDRPPVAEVLNNVISENEYYFIGPFDFEDQVYLNSKPASKYIVVLIGMDRSDRIQKELIADLKRNKPKIIVFHQGFFFFSGEIPAGTFINELLETDYVTFKQMGLEEKGYSFNVGKLDIYDLRYNFFILKEKQEEILNLFIEKGYITPPSI